jgi:hypothetical protein
MSLYRYNTILHLPCQYTLKKTKKKQKKWAAYRCILLKENGKKLIYLLNH